MPFGTACGQLRKQVLYMVADKAGMLDCFVCSARIEEPDDLTIEHKAPWLDVDPGLFWDLDNIAFSHRGCNLPHRRGGSRKYQEGMANCKICGVLPIEQFSIKTNGYPRSYCKPCRAERRVAGLSI